ncbi:hypothetical protein VE04_06427 [Pseudogymnoascus sp. 24MN13]|nr:hypothetical protein VE04_06427 [Pseudogymnoascus sp. 24MN13]
MADQCIVCLDVLDVDDALPPKGDIVESEVIVKSELEDPASATAHNHHADTQQLLAVIQTCGHILHDSCLKEWIQKANSCPICRQQFNLVEVHDKTSGPILSTYTVEDKKQVADFDPLAWIEDQAQEEELSRPCPICASSDDEEVLLLCDSCDAPYHTYCVGLDNVPHGQWFCMECEHEGANARTAEPSMAFGGTRRRNNERTQAQVRQARSRRRNRTEAWQGAWNQISDRIYDALELDIDYDEDNSLQAYRQSQRRTERERRELQQWQQRLAIASRQGAREVFRNSARSILHNRVEPPAPRESDEERRAWETYDRVREAENSGTPTRKRKSRSTTQSPREPATNEPERKLKRPRTRRVMENAAGSSSDGNPESQRLNGHRRPVAPAPRRPMTPSALTPNTAVAAPSFLSSLLKEVEMSAAKEDDSDNNEHVFVNTNSTSPAAEHSSPVLSPATSSYSTPRAMSLTPPPNGHGIRRSGSPLSLSSRVEPIYPPADYSPNRSPPERTARAENGHSRPSTPPASHLRHPKPRRPQQPIPGESSPTQPISIEAKEGIQKIVKKALDPHYKKPSGITKEQYADVNRLVSRMLYDKIVDPTALNDDEKSAWEKVASAEVAKAVEGLSA